jgi:hypothetical protein
MLKLEVSLRMWTTDGRSCSTRSTVVSWLPLEVARAGDGVAAGLTVAVAEVLADVEDELSLELLQAAVTSPTLRARATKAATNRALTPSPFQPSIYT